MKVCIDPGHGGGHPGAVYYGRQSLSSQILLNSFYDTYEPCVEDTQEFAWIALEEILENIE